MKEKIANALKTRYANLGLSKEAFDGVASILEKTISTETDIAEAISADHVSSFLKSMQSDFDKLRGESSTAKKALEDYKKLHPEEPNKPTEPGNNGLDEFKAMFESQKAEIEAMKAEMLETKRRANVEKMTSEVDRILSENGATNAYIRKNVLKGLTIGEGETSKQIADRIKVAYDTEYKEAFGEGVTPPNGRPHSEGYKKGDYAGFVEKMRSEGLIPKDANK